MKEGEREDIPQDCPDRLASVIKDCWHGDPTRRPEVEAVVLVLRPGDAQGNISAECSVPAVATPPPPSESLPYDILSCECLLYRSFSGEE